MSKSNQKFAVVIIVMFLGVLFFWWYTLKDYRIMTAEVQDLRNHMQHMQKHVVESERLLRVLDSLKQEVRDARVQSDAALEDSCRLVGDERIDYLVRLLETDLARRGGADAADGAAGTVPGAGGRSGGSGASAQKAH